MEVVICYPEASVDLPCLNLWRLMRPLDGLWRSCGVRTAAGKCGSSQSPLTPGRGDKRAIFLYVSMCASPRRRERAAATRMSHVRFQVPRRTVSNRGAQTGCAKPCCRLEHALVAAFTRPWPLPAPSVAAAARARKPDGFTLDVSQECSARRGHDLCWPACTVATTLSSCAFVRACTLRRRRGPAPQPPANGSSPRTPPKAHATA